MNLIKHYREIIRQLEPPREQCLRSEAASRVSCHSPDTHLAVDTSGSMWVKDMKPSRLAVALDAVERFNQSRAVAYPGSRLSLGLFEEKAHLVIPPRRAGEEFAAALRQRHTWRFKGYTNFVAALETAHRVLDPVAAQKRIVLLTDGGHNRGGSVSALLQLSRRIQAEGTLIEAVGIGAREDVDEELLLQIVSTLNGRKLYRWIGDSEKELIRHYTALARR